MGSQVDQRPFGPSKPEQGPRMDIIVGRNEWGHKWAKDLWALKTGARGSRGMPS